MPQKKRTTKQTQWHQREALVNEFVLLDAEIEEFKPRLFRHQKLRQLILDWHPHLLPEQEAIVPGTDRDILISSKDRLRSVTLEGRKKLFRLWGQQNFIAKAEVLLKSLPDPKDELGLYTEQKLTGPRHLHVVAKGKAAAPAA